MFAVATPDIPDDLRLFIFEHVDSVGQLDLLLFMREKPDVYYNAESLSRELRTNASSASSYLALLVRRGLLIEHETVKGDFRYHPSTPELTEIITKLAAAYKIRPHKILEMIFSSTKRARQFADAFSISKIHKPGDENG